jgi:hypothetical protein
MEKETEIFFKLKESEIIQIEVNAALSCKSVSAYIRDCCLQNKRKIDEVVIDPDVSYAVLNEIDGWNDGHYRKHIEVASLYFKYYGIDHRENKSEDTYKHMVNTLDDLFKNCLCGI